MRGRQTSAPACRRVMMAALVVEGLLLALPAQADLAVSLALPDPAALAPRTATVSAVPTICINYNFSTC